MKTITITSTIILLLSIIGYSAPLIDNNAVIKPDEVYHLSVKGVPVGDQRSWSKNYKVDKNGSIKLPLGGKVKIGGKSIRDAEKVIEKHLIDKDIYIRPKIKLTKKQA